MKKDLPIQLHHIWFMVNDSRFMINGSRFLDEPSGKVDYTIMIDTSLEERRQSFVESEGKSCSFDPELITPEYVYRMWGGAVAIEDIATAMEEVGRMR